MRRLFIFLCVLTFLTACGAAPEPTLTPLIITATPDPTLVAPSTATPPPSLEPTFTVTPIIPFTPTPDLLAEAPTLQAMLGSDMVAPIVFNLPEGWVTNSFVMPVPDLGQESNIPFTYYSGPVTGGTGTIVVLWGYPSIFPLSLAEVNPTIEGRFWADGLRLLYLAVLEPDCQVSLDVERTFKVGGLDAVGTYFAAFECPETPDTRGWFAVLQHEDVNFAFYTYADPMDILNGPALNELQAMLDRLRIDLSLLENRSGE